MSPLDFDNFDEESDEQRKDHSFEEEIKKLTDRLKESGGGSTNIEVLEEIVSFYLENEKYEEALHFVTLLLEYLPFSAESWQRKGFILNNLQRNQEALECFDKAISLNPVDADLIVSRGLTLDSCGRFEEAIACYDRVLEMDGSNEDALFNKALTMERLDRFDESIKIFNYILDTNPFHKEAWYELGFCYD